MKLYEYEAFANPRRVRIFAAEKGISLQREQVDVPTGEHLQAEHLGRNPYGAVPTLELGSGAYISESAAICRYLESLNIKGANNTTHLFGNTPQEQALVDMWDRRIESGLLNAVASYFHHGTEGLPSDEYQNADWGEYNRAQIQTHMTRLDEQLQTSQYIASNHFSMADITLLCAIDFAAMFAISISNEHVALQAWYELVNIRESVGA